MRPKSALFHALMCCLGLSLAGCSANFHSVFRHKTLEANGASITSVDAKQRAILSNVGKDNIQRFCSEPSPDVFSVVAQALAFGGSLSKSADPRAIEAALKAAFSSAEQGTTIPRTQTINMLRELMFRTCERYLNGGYSPLELSVQAVRDQRLMISILAVEQLTGAVTAPIIGIGATGSSASGAAGDAIVRLDDARKEKDAAEKAEKDAQSEVDEKKSTCDAIAKKVADKSDLSDDEKTGQETCSKQQKALASATKRSSTASEHYSDLKKLAENGGASVLASVSAEKIAEMARAHGESVEKVAGHVVEIVGNNFNDGSEVMLFCIKSLEPTKSKAGSKTNEDAGRAREKTGPDGAIASTSGPSALESDPKLRASCLTYLVEKVNLEQESLKTQQERLKVEQAESVLKSQGIATDIFDTIWPQMEATLKDPAARKRFVEKLKSLPNLERNEADCFATAVTREQARACFMKLEATPRYKVQSILTGGK